MRTRLLVLVTTVALVGMACASPAYDTQNMSYHDEDVQYVKPTWSYLDMKWKPTGEVDPSDGQCVLGLTLSGVGVVGAVLAPPVGTVGWFVFSAVTGSAAGLSMGDVLGRCWDRYKAYHTVFEVYTQCPINQAVLKSTFTDWAAATAYVELPSCKCSLMCQWGFDDPAPLGHAAPGLAFTYDTYRASKNYWHAGPNRLPGMAVESTEPPPVNYEQLATDLGLTYGGCDGVGAYNPDAFEGLPQC